MSDSRTKILVVEDDESMQDFLITLLEQEGFEVHWAQHGGVAKDKLSAEPFDIVLTDIVMPEVDGVEVLDYVTLHHADTPVIIMTGHSCVRQAVDLIRRGAADYVKKPFDIDEMLHTIRKSVAHRDTQKVLRAEQPAAASPAGPRVAHPRIIAQSQAMLPVFDMIAKVADTPSTVLIQGESGTGKELVAFAVHESSSRRSAAFIPVHCGAIPETLLESELFGHEKGSFTGAVARKEGVFKLADGGTMFLDEVSEMSAPLQVKLLRVLETGSFRRVGGTEDIHVDVRVVAATNRLLRDLVDGGLFRQDLYYRLNVFPIDLPPLRDRDGDVAAIVEHLLEKLRRTGASTAGIADEALAIVCGYHWPGNVRELDNVIERAAILSSGQEIRPEHLPSEVRAAEGRTVALEPTDLTFREAKKAFERRYLETSLAAHDGSVSAAAKVADMSRAHFYELIKKHGIDLRSFSSR
ncbi:sigma-54-dependent Fis family transcriptional regulator [bacterium]|nr:sigma-54-dependent Fis family transcriptional regulator [bacterium]